MLTQSARFFVISKDRGFDSLIVHIRSLGFEAHRVATIRAALNAECSSRVRHPARAAAARKERLRKFQRRKRHLRPNLPVAQAAALRTRSSRYAEADRGRESATHGQEKLPGKRKRTRASHRKPSQAARLTSTRCVRWSRRWNATACVRRSSTTRSSTRCRRRASRSYPPAWFSLNGAQQRVRASASCTQDTRGCYLGPAPAGIPPRAG